MTDLPQGSEPTPAAHDRYFAAPQVPRYVPAPTPDPRVGRAQQTYRSPVNAGRPGSVTAAIVITWVLLVGYGQAFARYIVGVEGDRRSVNLPYQVDNAFQGFAFVAGVLLAWTIVALVLSVLAFGGRRWARLALVISAGVSVPFQLAGAWYVLPLVGAAGTILAIVLLFTGSANDWYRARS